MSLTSALQDHLQVLLPAGSLRARFARGAFWVLAATLLARVLAVVASIVAARILGKTGFGELRMTLSTAGMFGVFAGLGLGLSATKHVAEFRNVDCERTGRIIGLCEIVAVLSGGLFAVGLFAFAPIIAARVINAPHLTFELRLCCALLFLDAMAGVESGALAGFEAFRTLALVGAVRGLLHFPVVVAGVYLWGLRGAVLGTVVVAALGLIVVHWVLRRECAKAGVRVRWRGAVTESALLWAFSLPAVLRSVIIVPVTWGANALLANGEDGYAQLGLFNVAWQWFCLIMVVPQLLGQVLLPILSERLGSGDKARARRLFTAVLVVVAAAAGSAALLLSVLSPHVVAIYGAQFSDGAAVLAIMVLAAALSAVAAPSGVLIAASGRMWIGALMNAGWSVAMLSCFFLFRAQGAVGLGAAYLSAYLVHGVWVFLYARRTLRSSA